MTDQQCEGPFFSGYSLATLILAAGQGTRMKSELHKVLHPIGGKPMLGHVLSVAKELGSRRTILVLGSGKEQVEAAYPDPETVYQTEQLGTGHAVMMAKEALTDFEGDILILYGDVPFLSAETIKNMCHAKDTEKAQAVVLGFTPRDTARYGRLVLAPDGRLERIVEYKDLKDSEKSITFCNSGVMLIEGARLFQWLDALTTDNAAGEYYLTDLVSIIRQAGGLVIAAEAPEESVIGVNNRADLAAAEALFQQQKRREFMEAGVTLIAPETVFFSHDTFIEPDVTIEPHVVIGVGVTIQSGTVIKAFSHIEGAHIASNATIGPYARLRPGSDIGESAKIGNFVEVKKAKIREGAKVNHLSYIGDAFVGPKANIGAGTITCNYDGFLKSETHIGAGAFIGSNSALVAPVRVEDGAIVGAGSVITRTVGADSVALTRAEQTEKKGAATKFRQLRSRQKEKLKKSTE